MDNDMEMRREMIKKEGECKDDGGVSDEKEEKEEMEDKEENEEKECEKKDGDVREEVLARYIVASWGRPRIKLVSTHFPLLLLCKFPHFPFLLLCKFAHFCFSLL